MKSAVFTEEKLTFRQSRFTIENCFVLNHPITKNVNRWKQCIFAFKSTYSIWHSKERTIREEIGFLWNGTQAVGSDQSPFYKHLFESPVGLNGGLKRRINVHQGVKQWWILASFLFRVHINDLGGLMKDPELRMSKGQELEVNDRSSSHGTSGDWSTGVFDHFDQDPEIHMPKDQELEVSDRSSLHPTVLPGLEAPDCCPVLVARSSVIKPPLHPNEMDKLVQMGPPNYQF